MGFQEFKMTYKLMIIHAGGITKKALHVGVEPFVICFCKTFVKY